MLGKPYAWGQDEGSDRTPVSALPASVTVAPEPTIHRLRGCCPVCRTRLVLEGVDRWQWSMTCPEASCRTVLTVNPWFRMHTALFVVASAGIMTATIPAVVIGLLLMSLPVYGLLDLRGAFRFGIVAIKPSEPRA